MCHRPPSRSAGQNLGRAAKLLLYLGKVSVNGHLEMSGRPLPSLQLAKPALPAVDTGDSLPRGTRDYLKELGAERFSRWIISQQQLLLADTTMRDAQQAFSATSMRTVGNSPALFWSSKSTPRSQTMARRRCPANNQEIRWKLTLMRGPICLRKYSARVSIDCC